MSLAHVHCMEGPLVCHKILFFMVQALDEIYDLDDEDRKILASEVAELDESEDSFASYQDKLAQVWKHKNKEHITQVAAEMEEKTKRIVENQQGEEVEKLSFTLNTNAVLVGAR